MAAKSWVSKVNEALTDTSLQELQKSAQRHTLRRDVLDQRNIQTPQTFHHTASSWPPASSFSKRRTKQRVLTPLIRPTVTESAVRQPSDACRSAVERAILYPFLQDAPKECRRRARKIV